MRVLCLYNNDNGEARQAVASLTLDGIDYTLGLADDFFRESSCAAKIAAELEDYNEDGGLFIVELPGADSERPDVVDQYGNEVECQHIEVELG